MLGKSNKRPKEDRVQADAQAAWDAGRIVFTAMIPLGTGGVISGKGNDDVSRAIEAILRMGWRLDTWATLNNPNSGPQAVPLFYRPDSTMPLRG
jgi:hypothetical protein